MCTRCRTPASRAALMRWAAWRRSESLSAKGAGCTEKTVVWPLHADASVAGSSRSPTARPTSSWTSSQADAEHGSRTRAVTGVPLRRRARATAPPCIPVAPVTRTEIVGAAAGSVDFMVSASPKTAERPALRRTSRWRDQRASAPARQTRRPAPEAADRPPQLGREPLIAVDLLGQRGHSRGRAGGHGIAEFLEFRFESHSHGAPGHGLGRLRRGAAALALVYLMPDQFVR